MTEGFSNPIVGGIDLVIPAIESPGFVSGTTGWIIRADGSVEFNNGVFRGTISDAGIFTYVGTPGLGTLAVSISPVAGTDSFGNPFPAGLALDYGSIGRVNWQRLGGGNEGWIEAEHNLITGNDQLTFAGPALAALFRLISDGTALLDAKVGVTQTLNVSGKTTLDGTFQLGGGTNTPAGDTFSTLIIDSFTVNFAGVSGVNATRQYKGGAFSFPIGSTPIVLPMLIVGANNDIAFNAQSAPTNTQFAYRFFQTRALAITTTITVVYIAIG